jgi:hypothetical protein
MLILRVLLTLLRALLHDRSQPALENLALRHQPIVLRRSVRRPELRQSDRLSLISLSRGRKNWRPSLVLAKPETVVGSHRKGFKLSARPWPSPLGPRSRIDDLALPATGL